MKKLNDREQFIRSMAEAAAREELDRIALRQKQIVDAFGIAIMAGTRQAGRVAEVVLDGELLGEAPAERAKPTPWQHRPENAAKAARWKRNMRKANKARGRAHV